MKRVLSLAILLSIYSSAHARVGSIITVEFKREILQAHQKDFLLVNPVTIYPKNQASRTLVAKLDKYAQDSNGHCWERIEYINGDRVWRNLELSSTKYPDHNCLIDEIDFMVEDSCFTELYYIDGKDRDLRFNKGINGFPGFECRVSFSTRYFMDENGWCWEKADYKNRKTYTSTVPVELFNCEK